MRARPRFWASSISCSVSLRLGINPSSERGLVPAVNRPRAARRADADAGFADQGCYQPNATDKKQWWTEAAHDQGYQCSQCDHPNYIDALALPLATVER